MKSQQVNKVAMHAPLGIIVAACEDGSLLFVDQSMKQVNKTIQKAHQDAISTIGFTNSGMHLITGGHDGGVKIWDIRNMTEVFSMEDVH